MEELEAKLIEIINESMKTMPFEEVRYVVRHVNSVVDSSYQIAVLKSQQQVEEVKPDE